MSPSVRTARHQGLRRKTRPCGSRQTSRPLHEPRGVHFLVRCTARAYYSLRMGPFLRPFQCGWLLVLLILNLTCSVYKWFFYPCMRSVLPNFDITSASNANNPSHISSTFSRSKYLRARVINMV